MNKTDDILERLKGQQPMIDDPDALTERIMSSLPDLEPSRQDAETSRQEDEGRARIVGWRWTAILAVAASVAVALLMVWPKQEQTPQEPSVVAQAVVTNAVLSQERSNSQPPQTKESPQKVVEAQIVVEIQQTERKPQVSAASKAYDRADYLPLLKPVNEPIVHYAAIQNAVDTIYKDPARMDEFIARMADFNEVEAVPLDCNPGSSDSTIVSNAYVFDDTEKFDVFGRLLQAACWYDSKTPGYLLNFSHQQLFFTLKDLRKGQKYLWIAERVNGDRILLYSTHSPIETDVSSSCYQNYREQLTHTIFSSSQF